MTRDKARALGARGAAQMAEVSKHAGKEGSV